MFKESGPLSIFDGELYWAIAKFLATRKGTPVCASSQFRKCKLCFDITSWLRSRIEVRRESFHRTEFLGDFNNIFELPFRLSKISRMWECRIALKVSNRKWGKLDIGNYYIIGKLNFALNASSWKLHVFYLICIWKTNLNFILVVHTAAIKGKYAYLRTRFFFF